MDLSHLPELEPDPQAHEPRRLRGLIARTSITGSRRGHHRRRRRRRGRNQVTEAAAAAPSVPQRSAGSWWAELSGGQGRLLQRCVGGCNVQTDIKEAVFLGVGDELVAVGSDDGRVYIHCSATGVVVTIIFVIAPGFASFCCGIRRCCLTCLHFKILSQNASTPPPHTHMHPRPCPLNTLPTPPN